MATGLQQQLAAIAANSTHQLDLKAQKARHSKSLLFEPRDAATQSFDTIYQICYEGFEELCMLDARFSSFARNIFSEQSKHEDRTQMTARENEELDQTLESFLGLVGGRLLLKPAMKAVEWLVRRFRVQEYNTETALMTFLPYHNSHIFPTLLSILPDQLPATFKWVHPYVASLQSPPRHAVLSAAINNQGFFSAFSQYVLRVAKARHHSAALLGFWASIAAQAVNGMIDSTRSGRDTIRKQREEDLLLRVLPILQSALSIRGVPELYLGSCMIMTILATKASLEDRVLDAMLEAIAGAWTQETLEDGLVCLAVIAEEKNHASVPTNVARVVLKTDGAVDSLEQMAKSHHRTDKLMLGLVLGALDPAVSKRAPDAPSAAKRFFSGGRLPEPYLKLLIETILDGRQAEAESAPSADINDGSISFLRELVNAPSAEALVQEVAACKGLDIHALAPGLLRSPPEVQQQIGGASEDALNTDQQQSRMDAGSLFTSLPGLGNDSMSFLDSNHDAQYARYSAAFTAAVPDSDGLKHFTKLKVLRRSKTADAPRYLTLLARLWTSSTHTATRARALELATAEIKVLGVAIPSDMQGLLPYAIVSLADDASAVRRAGAHFCTAMHTLYSGKETSGKDLKTWCADSMYGIQSQDIRQLSADDALTFLNTVVIPSLETCTLDSDHVARTLADSLNGKELKQSLRSAICVFFASHVAATPVLRVKLRLLSVLNRTGKVATEARRTVLLPCVQTLAAQDVSEAFSREGVPIQDLDKRVMGALSHRSTEEVQVLMDLAVSAKSRPSVRAAAFERLRELWPLFKALFQASLADFLLQHAMGGDRANNDAAGSTQAEALETVRSLALPSTLR